MSASMNKVQVMGHLGKDPEVKTLENGNSVATFSVATSRQWRDNNNEKQEEVEWFNCVAWQKTAEAVGQYLKKGSHVFIEGRMKTRTWEDEGGKHYRTELIANQVLFLDKRQNNDPGPESDGFSME